MIPINQNLLWKYLYNKEIRIICFNSLDSTNKFIKNNIHNLDNNTLVISREQIKGVGKFNRPDICPKDKGIYMSLLIKNIKLTYPFLFTPLLATVIMKILKQMGFMVKTKLVNDLYLNNKKILGILTEGSFNKKRQIYDHLIIGVGLNILEYDYPFYLRHKATSLFKEGDELKKDLISSLDFNFLASKITMEILDLVEDFKKSNWEKLEDLLKEYNLNLINYKKIYEFSKNKGKPYTFLGINKNAYGIFQSEDGKFKIIDTNELLNMERN